jgi:hypothetical protein
MNKKRSRFAPSLSVVNATLETRIVLSGGYSHQGAADVAALAARKAPTETSLAVSAGTLGQPITFNVTVRAPATAGAPQGTVNLIDHGNVIATLALSPATSTNGKSASREAIATLTTPPGGAAYFFGKHTVSAEFLPSGAFAKSKANTTFTVSQPTYTTLAGGVKIATIAPGSGPQVQAGQTAGVLYTGYLAKNGQVFDDSLKHGGTPFSFKVGAGQVVPGFDEGTAGMQVGETRIVSIPPAEGYGSKANGPIPANSTLIFVLTLESIS